MSPRSQMLAAMSRLVGEFGATVLVDAPPRKPLTTAQRIVARELVELPALWPVGPAKVLVITDYAFGPERGAWKDTVARTVRSGMVQAGFEIRSCAFVSMFNESAPVTAPGRGHIDDTYLSVRQAVRAADCDHVVLMGSLPQRVWNPSVKLEEVEGRVGAWRLPDQGVRWVLPVAHPNAVTRGLTRFDEWRTQLSRFCQVAEEGVGGLSLDPSCVACRQQVALFDTTGMGWCRTHVDRATPMVTRRLPKSGQTERLFNQEKGTTP
jgi:hypothetical protein